MRNMMRNQGVLEVLHFRQTQAQFQHKWHWYLKMIIYVDLGPSQKKSRQPLCIWEYFQLQAVECHPSNNRIAYTDILDGPTTNSINWVMQSRMQQIYLESQVIQYFAASAIRGPGSQEGPCARGVCLLFLPRHLQRQGQSSQVGTRWCPLQL